MILFCAVVYFGDDDNTYDLRLFDEIRLTKKVSVFPVGLIGYAMSTPIVQNNKSRNPGRVVGFSDPWFEKRKFPVGKNAIFTRSSLTAVVAQNIKLQEVHQAVAIEDSFLFFNLTLYHNKRPTGQLRQSNNICYMAFSVKRH